MIYRDMVIGSADRRLAQGRSRRWIRRGAAAALALSIPTPAFASNLQLITANVTPPDRGEEIRDTNFQYWISKTDCDSQIPFVFPLTLNVDVGTNNQVEAWIAPGDVTCETYDLRYGANKQCTKIDSKAAAQNIEFEITADQIAGARTLPAPADACAGTTSDPVLVTITFIEVSTSDPNADATSFATWGKTSIDLMAPDPPTIKDVTPSERAMVLEFTAPNMTTQNNIAKYLIFCDPPPSDKTSASGCTCAGSPGATDGTDTSTDTSSSSSSKSGAKLGGGSAGAAGAAGAGGGSGGDCAVQSSGGTCTSCAFEEGGDIPGDEYQCGTASATASSITAEGIENGELHAVAFAVVDKVGNVSPLSPLTCGTPAAVTDFYEHYKDSGGAGGGGCGVSPWLRQTSTLALGAGLVVPLALAWRRRRRPLARRPGDAK